MAVLWLMLLATRDLARSRARLEIELLAVRHQLHVLERTRPRRARLSRSVAGCGSGWRESGQIGGGRWSSSNRRRSSHGTAAAFAGSGRGRAVITRVDRLCRARFGI